MISIQNESYFLFGWVTLALLNAAVAQLQGRNAILWFLRSLLLGPGATIWLLVTYEKIQ
jgi:hypothetical protein